MLSHNNICDIPEWFGMLHSLEELHMGGNYISVVPLIILLKN